VRSIKPFGAFVDLGGADGLIPASEFSWQRVADLNEFVKIGQQVEVKINRIDFEARKIGLSMKQLTVSPFEEFAKAVQAGARVTGKVTRTADFGAFVELSPGVEGLIHISELSTSRVRRVRDVVEEGQNVIVEVLSMDPTTRRIALSLKKIASEEEVRGRGGGGGRAPGGAEGGRGGDGDPPGEPEPPRRDRRPGPVRRPVTRPVHGPMKPGVKPRGRHRGAAEYHSREPACPPTVHCPPDRRASWPPSSTGSGRTSGGCSSASPRWCGWPASPCSPTGTSCSTTCRASARRCWRRPSPAA
jgi:predicted RNA-binding protein with RPS1 domain